ncbi:hypothetical protein F5051DRAFT_431594 [Lentinula edodes]|nr:hypothetical protein F5051DRAFT_431594 [Lentinula edodes]
MYKEPSGPLSMHTIRKNSLKKSGDLSNEFVCSMSVSYLPRNFYTSENLGPSPYRHTVSYGHSLDSHIFVSKPHWLQLFMGHIIRSPDNLMTTKTIEYALHPVKGTGIVDLFRDLGATRNLASVESRSGRIWARWHSFIIPNSYHVWHALSLRSPDDRSERRNIEISRVLEVDAGNSFTIDTSNTVQTLAKFVKLHDPDFSCTHGYISHLQEVPALGYRRTLRNCRFAPVYNHKLTRSTSNACYRLPHLQKDVTDGMPGRATVVTGSN